MWGEESVSEAVAGNVAGFYLSDIASESQGFVYMYQFKVNG